MLTASRCRVCIVTLFSVLLVVISFPSVASAFSPTVSYSHAFLHRTSRTAYTRVRYQHDRHVETQERHADVPTTASEEESTTVSSTQDESRSQVVGLPTWLHQLNETFYTLRPSKPSQAISIHRVSTHPPIFVLRNILSQEERDFIQNQAQTMQQAETLNGLGTEARRNCDVTWLDHTRVDQIAQDVANVCLDPLTQYGGIWSEALQVLKYSRDGEYVLHHDSQFRVTTCLYYLNGVGETWFPLADLNVVPTSREEALEFAQDCRPGQDGVWITSDTSVPESRHVVNVLPGDAVVFYNYLTSGQADWRTLHAGLPTSKEKWIANHWFHIVNE